MSLPTVHEVRKRIEGISNESLNMTLRTAFLYAGRISEVVGKVSPSDSTVARGPRGTDASFDQIDGHDAVLFKVRTAKRKGLERVIALPTECESWALPLYEYFKEAKTQFVFPFTRQKIWRDATPFFEGFQCPIEEYKITGHNKVERHIRAFTLHSLRHLRATELRRFYHFHVDELAAYCGWKLGSVQRGLTSVMERYQDLSADYLDYFPKLLRKR